MDWTKPQHHLRFMGFEWCGRVQEVTVGHGKGDGLKAFLDCKALFLILRPVLRAVGELVGPLP
jgi:hypothetical protein